MLKLLLPAASLTEGSAVLFTENRNLLSQIGLSGWNSLTYRRIQYHHTWHQHPFQETVLRQEMLI